MGSARSYLQTFAAVALFGLLRPTGCVESQRPEVHGKARGSVELDCNFPSFNPADAPASLHVLEWVRQGFDVPVLIKFGTHEPRVHPKFEGRVSLVRTASLRLEALQLDDQGSYDCRILLLNESADELQNGTWILLSVTAPPTFTEAPPPVLEALVGSHVSLSCRATGNPPPSVTWSKDGSVIGRVSDKEGLLHLGAVSMQSAGRYTCRASNTEGNLTRVTKVEIKGPPVIISHPKSTSVNVSQNALLRCQAVADPPNMTYIWQKDGENVYHVESLKLRVKVMVDGTLLVSNVAPEDSGNYACTPTNGLLTPPTASANLTVMHPALALQMPPKTYLPMGMEGSIDCPVVARPPLRRVDWTKDGEPLDLSLYPGWILTPEGSLFMAAVNEDTAGTYKCTPYNSYGTMGSSGPTSVILQDPPSFSITPQKLYKQEAGRTLLIPCQGKDEDPTIKVTWSKVDLLRRTSYSIEPNGSLLLQPVTKDHQGWWECTATNRVATVRARMQLFVLGTSPHAATSLSISPGVRQTNISWQAGFDGGSAQTFSVWVKRVVPSGNEEKSDWRAVPVVPPNGTSLQVVGLSPSTEYQFSVLARNEMGTGPFSEIATAWTLDLMPRRSRLPPPPTSLSSESSSAGVVLRWSLPDSQQPPITAFALQSRTDGGEWLDVDVAIDGSSSEVVVPGLHKDCRYELRLLSRRGELLSEPSPSVNVSTAGMESYETSRLSRVPDSLLAGVLGGVGFMCLALALLLGSACLINHKRNRRRRRRENESPPAMYNCSPSMKRSSAGSPDSMLRKSLLPAGVLYPTTSSAGAPYSLSSPSRTDRSFGSGKTQQLKKNPPGSARGRLSGAASSPAPSLMKSISRGPDGRFAISSVDSDATIVHDYRQRSERTSSDRSSASLYSDEEDGKPLPFVLSVDLPPCSPAEAYPLLRPPANYHPYADAVSTCSRGSWATLSNGNRAVPFTFPVLPHIRSSAGQPSKTSSALVLQMEHERERGNLSHCLKLAQEREELERELRKYAMERRSPAGAGTRRQRSEAGGYGLSGECRSNTLPYRHTLGGRASLGLPPVHWDAYSHVSTPTLVPVLDGTGAPAPRSPYCVMAAAHPSASSSLNASLLQSEQMGGLTLPRLSSEFQQHERAEAAPRGRDHSPPLTLLEMHTSDSRRHSSLSRGTFPRLPLRADVYAERVRSPPVSSPDSSGDESGIMGLAGDVGCVEMSVDGPELEACVTQPPPRPMLHQRIASHLLPCGDDGGSLTRRPASLNDTFKVLLSPPYRETKLPRDVPQSWDSKRRSKSLDSRRRKETNFLAPDAWISSLSQENCSLSSSRHLDPSSPEPRASASTANTLSISPVGGRSRPRRSPEGPVMHDDVFYHDHEPSAEWPAAHPELAGGGGGCLEGTEGVPTAGLPHDSDQEVLEVEAGGSEGVPDSRGSYSSYASSGRGSMEQAGGRLSLCRLSPVLSSSPETVERSLEDAEDEPHTEPSLRRKASVDENYEWDAVDFCPRPAVDDGLLPSLDPLKPARCRSLPSMQCSTETKALRNYTRLSLLPGSHSGSSAEPEPGMVLF